MKQKLKARNNRPTKIPHKHWAIKNTTIEPRTKNIDRGKCKTWRKTTIKQCTNELGHNASAGSGVILYIVTSTELDAHTPVCHMFPITNKSDWSALARIYGCNVCTELFCLPRSSWRISNTPSLLGTLLSLYMHSLMGHVCQWKTVLMTVHQDATIIIQKCLFTTTAS